MSDTPKLSDKQRKLLVALCEISGAAELGPEARRIAGPLLSKGLVWWFGFGKFRVYQATDKGRALMAELEPSS